MVNGLSSVVDYVYDDANRLASVNGVTYTWDANGNLLNDGVNAYTYNTANQLKTMTGPSVNTSYAYNGLGDRLPITVETMNLNYDIGPIEQYYSAEAMALDILRGEGTEFGLANITGLIPASRIFFGNKLLQIYGLQ